MERRSFVRFPVVTAIAVALLALVAFSSARVMAQDDVVVPIDQVENSGISGDASLTDNGDGTTTVDILVDGATGGHPANIYAGACSALGDAVYPLTDVDASGESVTVVDATLESLTTGGPYAIGIQLSANGVDTQVACGDIPAHAAGGQTVAAASTTETPEATPAAVGGTSSVTDIGASGVGTTFGGSASTLVLVMGATALLALAGAFGIRRRVLRG